MQTKSRGFTLIELLVVIAIIGILASVVLASLNSARAKGSDAAIKSSINNARAQAEIFYDTAGNNYTNVCTAAGGISTMLAAADNANGAGVSDCNSSATAWAMAAQLVSVPGDYYCVDSTGTAKTSTGVVGVAFGAAAVVCP
ncbi:MAG: type II secretion system protein [Patescibacteria group bacterium]